VNVHGYDDISVKSVRRQCSPMHNPRTVRAPHHVTRHQRSTHEAHGADTHTEGVLSLQRLVAARANTPPPWSPPRSIVLSWFRQRRTTIGRGCSAHMRSRRCCNLAKGHAHPDPWTVRTTTPSTHISLHGLAALPNPWPNPTQLCVCARVRVRVRVRVCVCV